ncbi:hypothetical protein EWH99_00045 [Sporolactobacillus sp. THM7-7]|nr:hypothetical protein EWH99_00045 [Sporolactobacillus sp. THM7-7]
MFLCRGTKEAIQAETKRLIKENGRQGILLSGDCSIPFDTDDTHAQWVSETANSLNVSHSFIQ